MSPTRSLSNTISGIMLLGMPLLAFFFEPQGMSTPDPVFIVPAFVMLPIQIGLGMGVLYLA